MSQAMEDKDAIREAMAKYCRALDTGRFGDVAALFVPDGEWVTDYGAGRGRAEIETLLSNTVPRKGEGPQRKHYISNIVIRLNGGHGGMRLRLPGHPRSRGRTDPRDGWHLSRQAPPA